jgi:hypothetical protein
MTALGIVFVAAAAILLLADAGRLSSTDAHPVQRLHQIGHGAVVARSQADRS